MTCGCNNRNSSGRPTENEIEVGGCGSVTPATPCGQSDCNSSCPEDHCQKIYISKFYTDIRPDSSWNIPACNETAEFVVTNLMAIPIGSYIWSANFGYFKVTAFDVSRGKVTVENTCYTGNAPVGTLVPGCTEFLVTPEPCCEDQNQSQSAQFPYVAVDFTAPPLCPATGCCTVITVTTAIGLSVGSNVQIGTGVYAVDSIIDLYHITICNNGSGIIPGTPVIAQDGAGNYQYPIVSLDANPCNKTPVDSGTLVVCKNGGVTNLGGTVDGMVPVLVDHTTGEVEYQSLAVEAIPCEELTVQLELLNGTASYTLTLTGVSHFTVGDILHIEVAGNDYQITLTNVDAINSQVTGTFSPVPGAGEDHDIAPVTTLVCIISCCERMAIITDDLQDQIDLVSCAPLTRYGTIPVAGSTYTPNPTNITELQLTISNNIVTVTSPDECDDATFLVEAFISVDMFLQYVPTGLDDPEWVSFIYSELLLKWSVGNQGGTPEYVPGRATYQWPIRPAYRQGLGYPVGYNGDFNNLPGSSSGYPLSFWRAELQARAIVNRNTATALQLGFFLLQDADYVEDIEQIQYKYGGYTKCTRIT